MSDDESEQDEEAERRAAVLIESTNRASHRRVRVIDRARHESGEIILEVEVCDGCKQRTPRLHWYTCDEWIIKTLVE